MKNMLQKDIDELRKRNIKDLSETNLEGVDLSGANLHYSDLSGANLTNAILSNVTSPSTNKTKTATKNHYTTQCQIHPRSTA